MTVVNHMHISDTLGGAPENAPNKSYFAFQRAPEPTIFMAIERNLSGSLMSHVLGEATPTQKDNYEFILHVTAAQLVELEGFQGKEVYFVDHNHCANGADHTAYVKQGVLMPLSNIQNYDPMLARYRVRIRFEES